MADEKARALSRGSFGQQLNQPPAYDMTADQQIRAKALEHTVRLAIIDGSMRRPNEIREMCDMFELYIREGK